MSELCDTWLASRHGLRATTLAGYRQVLKPVIATYGTLAASQLDKAHIVRLVRDLQAGTANAVALPRRRNWAPRSVNLMLFVLRSVLADAVSQGVLERNVAALVDRIPQSKKEMATFTEAEVRTLLAAIRDTELEQAWHLALYGLRRGEIAGLRWADVDLKNDRLQISQSRVTVDGVPELSLPKTKSSARALPISRDLHDVLLRALARQASDADLAGASYDRSGYVVVDRLGTPLHPETISARWDRALADAGLPRIRLHDARHTCGTLLHLQGVPVAVIAAWLGHADASFTMRVYVHSQNDVLNDVKRYFERGIER